MKKTIIAIILITAISVNAQTISYVDGLKSDLRETKTKAYQIKRENISLKKEIDKKNSTIINLNEEITKLKKQISKLNNDVSKMKKNIPESKPRKENTIKDDFEKYGNVDTIISVINEKLILLKYGYEVVAVELPTTKGLYDGRLLQFHKTYDPAYDKGKRSYYSLPIKTGTYTYNTASGSKATVRKYIAYNHK